MLVGGGGCECAAGRDCRKEVYSHEEHPREPPFGLPRPALLVWVFVKSILLSNYIYRWVRCKCCFTLVPALPTLRVKPASSPIHEHLLALSSEKCMESISHCQFSLSQSIQP